MSSTELPKAIDPLHSCQKARRTPYVILGHMQIGPWLKIGELLEGEGEPNKNAVVTAKLSFSQDESDIPVVQVTADAVIKLRCQRCMTEMDYVIHSESNLGIVLSFNKLNDLPEQYEPLLLEDPHHLSVPDFLAEELHLALPLVSRHETECQPVLAIAQNEKADKREKTEKIKKIQKVEYSAEKEKRKPFSDLDKLMKPKN